MSNDLESQRARLREAAQKAGYSFTETDVDPADALLDAINTGEYDAVIAWDEETDSPKVHKLNRRDTRK